MVQLSFVKIRTAQTICQMQNICSLLNLADLCMLFKNQMIYAKYRSITQSHVFCNMIYGIDKTWGFGLFFPDAALDWPFPIYVIPKALLGSQTRGSATDTWCNNNVIITPKRRRFHIKMTLSLRRVPTGWVWSWGRSSRSRHRSDNQRDRRRTNPFLILKVPGNLPWSRLSIWQISTWPIKRFSKSLITKYTFFCYICFLQYFWSIHICVGVGVCGCCGGSGGWVGGLAWGGGAGVRFAHTVEVDWYFQEPIDFTGAPGNI